jgi:hypothetical protein
MNRGNITKSARREFEPSRTGGPRNVNRDRKVLVYDLERRIIALTTIADFNRTARQIEGEFRAFTSIGR